MSVVVSESGGTQERAGSDDPSSAEQVRSRDRENLLNHPTPIYTLTQDGVVTSWNRRAEALFGYTEEEMVGKILPLVPEEHRGESLWFPERNALKNPFARLSITRARKDGTLLHLELTASPIWDEDKKIKGILASVTDVSEQCRQTKALREAEERSRMLFNMVPDPMFVLDDTGQIVEANDFALDRYGYSKEEIIGMTVRDLAAENYHLKASQRLQEAFGGGAQFEWRHRKKDGTNFPVEITSHPIQLHGVPHVIASVRDISQRKIFEAKRERDDRRIRSLLTIAQYPAKDTRDLLDFTLHQAVDLVGSTIGFIYRVDDDQKSLTLNSWSNEAMKECAAIDRPTHYTLENTGIWGDALRNRQPLIMNDFSAPHPHKHGLPPGHVSLKRLLVVPVFERDMVVALVGVANKTDPYGDDDITQLSILVGEAWRLGTQREAVSERKATENRYHELVENLEELVFSLDTDGNFLFLNAAVAKFGFSTNELRKKSLTVIVHPEDREKVQAALVEALRGNMDPIELKLQDRSGTLRTGRFSCRKCRARGQVELIGVITDLTKQHQAEEQLRMAQRLEAGGQLAGGIATDFNNLISVIQGYAEFALKEAPSEGTLKRDLGEIYKASKRAADLTKQLMAFSRRQVLAPTVVDLNSVLSEMESTMERVLGGSIGVALNLEKNLPTVRIDSSQFEQVMLNLLMNARDAMPSGGHVEIQSAMVELDRVVAKRLGSPRTGTYVQISVRDTGIGIPSEHLSRIFDPFFTTKASGKSAGLGLATVFGIIKQSEGFVEAQSQPNQGSTFHLYFPVVEAKHRPAKIDTVGTLLVPCNESILVVDDDLPMLEVTKRLLESQGFKVFTAENGEHALVEAERIPEQIDLLLTDIKMPRLNGRELAKLLAKCWPGLRVLYMSGNPNEDSEKGTGEERVPRVLPKPFSREELIQAVRSTLDKGKGEAGSESPGSTAPPGPPTRWFLSAAETDRIQSAVMAADYQALVNAAESYSHRNPDLAMRMRALVERFEYEAILDLFQAETPLAPAPIEGKS